MASLSELIKQAAIEQGFHAVGIAGVAQSSSNHQTQRGVKFSPNSLLDSLLTWLSQGYHGTMEWMARAPERRADPSMVLPGCKSLICVGMNYFTDDDADERAGNGRIARYAWGKDYHRVLIKRLQRLERHIVTLAPEAKTRSYVDTGPVMEKVWAQQAGIGWIGKHSNLVSPTVGSWLLLGEILTSLELEPDEPGTDLCGSCSLCIQACPTKAIIEPYVVDATKCISYLTIEHRGEFDDIPQERQSQMGNRIFGCDDCIEICPYNAYATPTNETAFAPTPLTQGPHLIQLSQMNEQEFSRTFRGSPIRRAKHSGFQRNVRVALTNQHEQHVAATSAPR